MADGPAAHRQVEFGEAISLFFKNYANFKGRSSRGAYWWWFLASFVISCALATIDLASGSQQPGSFGLLGSLFSIAVLIPNIAVGVRRLHDTDRSGWWLLVGLIPLAGLIWLIILFCEEGERSANEYGPDMEAGREAMPTAPSASSAS